MTSDPLADTAALADALEGGGGRASADEFDRRLRSAVPYRLDADLGLVAAATDPAACR